MSKSLEITISLGGDSGKPPAPIKVLELQPHADWDSKLFKVRTGWVLRFKLAPCLYARDMKVFTDFPETGSLYKRGQLRELAWKFSTKKPTWDPDRYIDINLAVAGAYRFTFKEEGKETNEGSGYFVVDPDLGYSPNGIACQTYITKLLGPLSQWKQRLQVAKESGYNMVHFTPMQQLGSSRSAYSISNQLRLDSSYLPSGYQHSEVSACFTNCEGQSKTIKVDTAFTELRTLVGEMKRDWEVLSIVDVVWNHTSFDTPWIIQHPEAGYNLFNCPHLRPAYALDVTLYQFSQEIAEGKWESVGIRPEIRCDGDVNSITCRLLDTVFPRARLWEYFTMDVDAIVEEFRSTVYKLNGGNHPKPEGLWLEVIQDHQYRRLGSGVDKSLTLELFNIDWPGVVCFEERIERCCAALREDLRNLNRQIEDRVQGQLHQAVNNIAGDLRYQFLDPKGPCRERVTSSEPLVKRYFCVVSASGDLHWSEMESQKGEYILAHNGWVMNADPLVNFAAEGSQVYFQRELIVWADSIKLRYGEEPQDSPWLWDHMTRYTQTMAWIFDGFRLDNCHNTPINVAEGLLDRAREVNPDLYLVAELFTGSEDRDNYFVNRLGINSLVREAMFAPIPFELGRLVYKYGGDVVASFLPPEQALLKPATAHAMFMDATHDNDPGHILSRSVQDTLPNTALVSIGSCASGGCRGYDELVPHMIHVVTESRCYPLWSDVSLKLKPQEVGPGTGILAAKNELNKIHRKLAEDGFSQVYVDQVTEDIVAVTRHSPSTHQSVILMAHTSFHPPEDWAIPTQDNPNSNYSGVPPLTVPGQVQEIIMEARLVQCSPAPSFQQDQSSINGLQSHVLDMRTHIPITNSRFCHLATSHPSGTTQEVQFDDFAPSSVIVFRVSLVAEAVLAVKLIRSFLGKEQGSAEGRGLRDRLEKVCSALSLLDLNYALYRCDSEEQDDGNGGGAYNVPGAGSLVYCGLQGIMSMLETVRDNNDLGHPICDNLRAGDWLADYSTNRLTLRKGTKPLADVLTVVFAEMKKLPRYLIPCYFEAIISLTHRLLTQSAIGQMNSFVRNGSSLVHNLALGTVQMCGVSRSAKLPPSLPGETPHASIAAGLPHFSNGAMRCWGRDTFIALRGLLLTTGCNQQAWDTLLSFAACLRHGLIPNLLNGGSNPRYNCRDAPWWWLQSIQDYCKLAPSGYEILQAEVRKIYCNDDSQADFMSGKCVPLCELIQEVLQKHSSGIEFRERGAGPGLDKDMTPPGFNVRAGVDTQTGFVYGGSVHNCGTWMDKVGESTWAGNKGVPATPRDGSAVELVGLCYSAVTWLAKLHQQGIFLHSGVKLVQESKGAPRILSYSDWAKRLKSNFEQRFWIPADRTVASEKEGQEAGYIHRTAIYKDLVGATQRYADYQLRPNFPIAMAVAPELFTPQNAWLALGTVEEILLGPLGMRTLDPSDYVYNGYYINSVDSGNYNTARGFNYHQGPEWLWVLGYFLRAKLQFARRSGASVDDTISFIHRVISTHAQALKDSPWKGLPELTNKDGVECSDSCPVQAWSNSTLLDVLYDISLC